MNKIDFCSYFPDHLGGYELSMACRIHDIMYTKLKKRTVNDELVIELYDVNKYASRLEADNRLFENIRMQSNILIASVMWVGVRLFGWRFYKK